MGNVLQNLQLACAICKICLYSCFTCAPCRRRRRTKLEVPVICVGLQGSGKSTLLNLLNGESIDDIQPTQGFNIKAVDGLAVTFSVKELGGSDNVRQYWKHYYDDTKGVIFVLDSTADNRKMGAIRDALATVLVSQKLAGRPCLILGNFQDKDEARCLLDLNMSLRANQICAGRSWCLHTCSRENKRAVQAAFENFEKYFTGASETEPVTNKI